MNNFGTFSPAPCPDLAAWTAQLPGKQLLAYFKPPCSALQKLEIGAHISCPNGLETVEVEQLPPDVRGHACHVRRRRADSWGQELLQPSQASRPQL